MKIKNKFDAPFGVIPELRLSYVSRWGIVSMDRQQSVAEHVFGVMRIVEYLCDKLEHSVDDQIMNVLMAMHHDDDEIYSGDIPYPAKHDVHGECGECSVIKLADLIESYRYLNAHCNDSDEVFTWTRHNLYAGIKKQVEGMNVPYTVIEPLMEGN